MQQTQRNPLSNVRADYERDGYVVIRNVVDSDLVREGREHVEWLRAKNPNLRAEQLGHTLMTNDPFWVRLISDDRLLDVAAQFIGDNIALFASHYIAKPPFDGQPVLWHQDGSFWPLEPMEVTTLWLAVDDSTPENGCMRVIPGSHRMDLQEMMARTDVANVLSAAIDPALVDDSQAVDIVLAAGDVSIHHPNLVHGSNANHSSRWRRGLTIRYIPTTTRIISQEPWPSAFALRGTITPGVNEYQPWPAYSAGTHMPFADAGAWNERAAARNQQLAASSTT
jgi:ectoine hydroxylase-related dioxygenase (phytanoyl-CoA dioxygenase family)